MIYLYPLIRHPLRNISQAKLKGRDIKNIRRKYKVALMMLMKMM
jgi:hypothetical protein